MRYLFIFLIYHILNYILALTIKSCFCFFLKFLPIKTCNRNEKYALILKPDLAACSLKTSTRETGAGVKKRVLFKCQQHQKTGASHPKSYPNISAQEDSFIRGERESRTGRSKGGCWKVLCMQTGSICSDKDLSTGQAMIWCVSTWFYVILLLY